jgi:hypothetical protein
VIDIEILVVGPSRGGTSGVASLVHGLGFENLNSKATNFESVNIVKAFSRRDAESMKSVLDSEIADAGRNPKSLKLTIQGPHKSMPLFLNEAFRSKVLVGVFKNPFSIAMRRASIHGQDVAIHLENVLAEQQALLETLRQHDFGIAFDFDYLSSKPLNAISDLSEVLGGQIGKVEIAKIAESLVAGKRKYLHQVSHSVPGLIPPSGVCNIS